MTKQNRLIVGGQRGDNFTCEPVPGTKNDWYVKFNKRVPIPGYEQLKLRIHWYTENGRKATFTGNRLEARKFGEKFRDMWIERYDCAFAESHTAFSIESATLEDAILYWEKKVGKDRPGKHGSQNAYKKHKSHLNSIIRTCGHIKIYPGLKSPYWRNFLGEFEPIFHDWTEQWSGATIEKYVRILKRVFTRLQRDELITARNPLEDDMFTEVKAKGPRLSQIVTQDDAQNLLKAAKNHEKHLVPILQFMLQIPCRKNELTKLPKTCLNLANRQFTVPAHMTKSKRPITKSIPPNMYEYFFSIPKRSNYIFYRKIGGTKRVPEVKYLPIGDFKKAYAVCAKHANIPQAVIHDMRKYAATSMVQNGIPMHVIENEAGWKPGDGYRMLKIYFSTKGANDPGELERLLQNTDKINAPAGRKSMTLIETEMVANA